MSRRFAASAVFAVATLALSAQTAAPADAPLSQTKQQLQGMQKDRAAEKAGTGITSSGLREAIPTPQVTPALDLPAPLRMDEREKDAKQKQDSRRNWLLDGYDKLKDRKADPLTGRRGAATAEGEVADEAPLDPADPDYFLRVYEKQRAETLARQEAQSAAATESRLAGGAATANDAFAPFLKDWLANSPVRDALGDVAGAGASNRGAGPGSAIAEPGARGGPAADGAGGATAFTLPGLGGAAAKGPAPNPFVQALGLPTAGDAAANDFKPAVADALNPAPASSPNLMLPAPESRNSDPPRVAPPPAQDAKKYFPQLKKF